MRDPGSRNGRFLLVDILGSGNRTGIDMHVTSKKGNVKGAAMSRTAEGFPKLREEAAIKFWPMLDADDRKFLKEKYSLNLEI